jgi:antitoxin CcdA
MLSDSIGMTEVITVRVNKSLKAKLRKHRIDVSKTVRDALEDEVKKREDAELVQAISDMKAVLQKIPDDEIVKAIRESRDQR